jgi:AcrR family transcriptional regulator
MPRVTSRRRYNSTLRRQQAAQTRARILEAAQRLFTEHGYASTTIEAIASEAGVATDTVYATFHSKAGLLHALIDVRAGGDEEPVALIDRPEPQAARVEKDQRRQVEAVAAGVAEILERARPVDDIMRNASTVDPDIAAVRAEIHRGRHENMRKFVSWVAANGPLREGLAQDEAADLLWTLAGPEVNRLLRVDRGWSLDRYQAWLGQEVARTLLA